MNKEFDYSQKKNNYRKQIMKRQQYFLWKDSTFKCNVDIFK